MLEEKSANPSYVRTYSCLAPLVRATPGQNLEGWSHQHLSISPNLGRGQAISKAATAPIPYHKVNQL